MRRAECIVRITATMPDIPGDWTDADALADLNRGTEEMLRTEFAAEPLDIAALTVNWQFTS